MLRTRRSRPSSGRRAGPHPSPEILLDAEQVSVSTLGDDRADAFDLPGLEDTPPQEQVEGVAAVAKVGEQLLRIEVHRPHLDGRVLERHRCLPEARQGPLHATTDLELVSLNVQLDEDEHFAVAVREEVVETEER